MRPVLIIATLLILIGCKGTPDKASVTAEGSIIEQEVELPFQVDTASKKNDTDLNKTNLVPLTDTIVLIESSNVQDDLVNDYLVKDLESVRKNFKRINSIKKWASTEKFDLWESTEGGEAQYYYSEHTLEKIIVRHFGETFQNLVEYYLRNDSLSFVYEKSLKYNRPIYWDSIAMTENNDNQVFDYGQSEIIEVRSYFLNNILVHQLNSEDCGSPFNEEYLRDEQNLIQTKFNKLIDSKYKK